MPEHAPYDDALIAAVAQANEMVIATRNIKHFKPLGVDCIDPWLCADELTLCAAEELELVSNT